MTGARTRAERSESRGSRPSGREKGARWLGARAAAVARPLAPTLALGLLASAAHPLTLLAPASLAPSRLPSDPIASAPLASNSPASHSPASTSVTGRPLAATGDDPAEAPLALGRAALERGELALARRHLERARIARPHDPELLALLVEASDGDLDERARWTYAWTLAGANENGRGPSRAKLGAKLFLAETAEALSIARAAAVDELAGLAEARRKDAKRRPDEELVANWARRLARELAHGAPRLEAAADRLDPPRVEVLGSPWKSAVKDIERMLASALSSNRPGLAIRAARVLQGIAAQADFDDLQGPVPTGLGKLRGKAAEGLARARQLQREHGAEPWSIDDLEWLSQEEGESFTRRFDDYDEPGLALSPRAWYRIETDCGLETLVGTARTIEDHHTRLAHWYGQDPFEDIQGTVRVVPEASGLEAEGAPFWWAGGFQSGNVTTVRFSVGTIEGLGHLLVHELTHRFDGALFPGQPSWLSEGKAVWTAGAYGHSTDPSFDERYASLGAMGATLNKGYGGAKKLGELVDGTLEEYRDNYSAGHALYVFLNTWRQDGDAKGERVFRERLNEYMRSLARFRGKPRAHFVAHFADGEGGRPDGFDAFAELFGEYLQGFHWKTEQPWKDWYVGSPPAGPNAGYVYDEPTWVWSRQRAEPFFGDDQARLAAEFLEAEGREKEALEAYVWSLACDGRRPNTERRLVPLLEGERRGDAAWVLRAGLPAARPEPAPFLNRLPKCAAFLEKLEAAAREAEAAGAFLAAGARLGDRNRLASRLGLVELAPSATLRAGLAERLVARAAAHGSDAGAGANSPSSAAADDSTALERLALGPLEIDDLPLDDGPRWLELGGWTESGLTGYDEERHEGLWYSAGDGDLHVGRERPRGGTGKLDPRAHQRQAFAVGEEHVQPGSWRFRARVQATTAYVSGAVVFAHTRRDRNVRFDFTMGDFMFAIGESDDVPTFDFVDWHLHGLFEREGALDGSRPRGRHDFGRERTAFDLELVVDGPSVSASIDGQPVGLYTSPDGVPLEGRIGFAVGMGAIRVELPRVERLERARHIGLLPEAPVGLEPARTSSPPFEDLVGQRLHGIEPASQGLVVLWIGHPPVEPSAAEAGEESAETGPEESDRDEDPFASTLRKATQSFARLAKLLRRDTTSQPVLVLAPSAIPEGARAELERSARATFDGDLRFETHAFDGRPMVPGGELPDRGRQWVFFVDSSGVLRKVAPFFGMTGTIGDDLRHWLTVFRDNGRPERDLPEAKRASEEEADEGEDGED